MKYLHLIWAALLRRTLRTALTLLSVTMAFLLFGLLTSVRYAFLQAGQDVAAAHRLVTLAKSSYMFRLPLSLYDSISAVPGVEAATYIGTFYGTYQDPKNHVGGVPTVSSYFKLFPELKIPPAQWSDYENTRTGALVGATYVGTPSWDLAGPALTGPPEKLAHVLRKLGAIGVGQVQVRLRSRSLDELLDQIEAFGTQVGPLLDG